MTRKVFYSFHYKTDVTRVQMVRNIGVLDKNPLVAPNKWEELKRKGDKAVKDWIDSNLKGKSCLIVLIGENTANSKWVDYEIRQAWDSGKAVVGIYIHNLKDLKGNRANKGRNPFDSINLKNGNKLSSYITCHSPSFTNAYQDIANNLENWIEDAITSR
ncbi:TIR domain-containing protein [uncultured Psychrobacter sp.]|uniref:TIR domain-containing protein n=1 Tax=uncultured Psychrobacter sp. TaxID=259303 RepID=UPI0030D941ED